MDSNKPVIIEHVSPAGECYTEELRSFGGGGVAVTIKDVLGKEICMNGSGGARPWDIK